MKIQQRALQIWTLLVCAARERRTYTYEDIAGILRVVRADFIGGWLGPIMYYCQRKDWPPLTVLVVKKETGQPGDGYERRGGRKLSEEREAVFAFDWFEAKPPESEDFRQAREWGKKKEPVRNYVFEAIA